jgi:hypothetical protein
MTEPPFMIDGARVLEFATLDEAVERSGPTSTVFGGMPVHLHDIAGVAVVQDLVEDGVFLILCNDEWVSMTSARFADAPGAKASAEEALPVLRGRWQAYRDLTPEERKELETTRAFLRELAQEYPDE